jgi:HNH endonuclease
VWFSDISVALLVLISLKLFLDKAIMNDREKIPEPLKRQIRQQCNFGCAICGMPIFEYDHIIPYAEVKCHTLDNLILLCPNHHSAKGKQLDVARIKEARLNPFNSGKNVIEGFKLEPNRKIDVMIGSTKTNRTFTNSDENYYCLWVNGISFFTIHYIDNWVTVSFIATDAIGQTILTVEYGELRFAADIWDYKYEGSNIQIRIGRGEILLDLNLSNYKVEILRGCFIHFPNKDGFIVQSDGALLTLSNNYVPRIIVGGSYQGYSGAIGVWNKTKYPDIVKPHGFGSFVTV